MKINTITHNKTFLCLLGVCDNNNLCLQNALIYSLLASDWEGHS
jgi:hypothetical protein